MNILSPCIRSCCLKASNWDERPTTWDHRFCFQKDLFSLPSINSSTSAFCKKDEIEYWKIRMCRLTLLVEQVTLFFQIWSTLQPPLPSQLNSQLQRLSIWSNTSASLNITLNLSPPSWVPSKRRWHRWLCERLTASWWSSGSSVRWGELKISITEDL